MTVAELIERLKKLPPDAYVLRGTSEYNSATESVLHVDYHKEAGWGIHANTVILR